MIWDGEKMSNKAKHGRKVANWGSRSDAKAARRKTRGARNNAAIERSIAGR